MNSSENIKTLDPHRLLMNLLDKMNLKRNDKNVALWNCSIYYTWKNFKKSYKNNKFKTLAPKWNEKFELHDRFYFVLDIQHHFEYIIKRHKTVINKPPIRIYVNKFENRIMFRNKIG